MTDYLGRLAKRFTDMSGVESTPDIGTRDIGGQFRDNQPYISGDGPHINPLLLISELNVSMLSLIFKT